MEAARDREQLAADGGEPLDLDVWNGDWLPSVPSNYQGLKLNFPMDMGQVAALMESFVQGQKDIKISNKRLHDTYSILFPLKFTSAAIY
ncbi:unnamed protein product [Trichobilharzia regenti]|nr:unnamed protein product [Trichobilharzia regenti]